MLQSRGSAEGLNGHVSDGRRPLSRFVEEKPPAVNATARRARFEATFLPHLPAAYNLARWLTRDGHDAEDVIQEAYLRAFRSFAGFRGGDGRAWFLAIVRNTSLTWLERNRPPKPTVPFDESRHDRPGEPRSAPFDSESLGAALEVLPSEFREAVVLREIEGRSYKEISAVTGVPIGTVMSRLSRGRGLLRQALAGGRPDPS